MGWATYVARRELSLGHVAASSYTLPLTLTAYIATRRRLGTAQETLNGRSEDRYFGQVTSWHVSLAPMFDRDSALVREFLGSTEDGQVFTFDPDGSPGQTGARARSVKRDDQGATESVIEGDGGTNSQIVFEFDIKPAT